MTRTMRQAVVILIFSVLALVGAEALTPNVKLAEMRAQKIDLEAMLPESFAGWTMQRFSGGVVNPVQEANLARLYSQLLSRTYVSSKGERVMVSVAYGEDQRKYLALHYPEVCYPAQGFAVRSNRTELVSLPTGLLPMRKLETFMGPNRYEPVSYWTTMGDYTSFGGMPRRMIELRYGIQRQIPDGLLFRVSTIGQDSAREFAVQERFVSDLLGSVPASTRDLLTGKYQQ